ncbi:MAG: GMC family oxidoreductase [Actinobacteria bacterium]|nr:GMC family oxidoreductase [Actinomycetota bacterium]
MDIRGEALLVDVLSTFLASYGDAEHERNVMPDGTLLRISQVVAALPHDRDRRDLDRLLGLIDNPLSSRFLHRQGRWSRLSHPQKIRALHAMSASPFNDVRKAFRSLKSIAGMVYSTGPQGGSGASWGPSSYPGPAALAGVQRVDNLPRTYRVDDDEEEMTCDVVIVGSGAGGGVAAGVLADAGLDVVILERARPPRPSGYTYYEDAAYRHHYVDGAMSTTSDGAIAMLAGSSLGGGTTINYSTSFAPPASLLADWDAVAGFDGVFTGNEMQKSISSVISRLGVTTAYSHPSRRDTILETGLQANAWSVETIARNVQGCDEAVCGFCTMGCPIGAKQSTAVTYLRDAARHGARIVTGATVNSIEFDGGTAVGATATVDGAQLRVRARHVVVAAGSLATPTLLRRSGVKLPALGRHLRLHPVTVVWGRFSERVNPWEGTMQARVSKEFADLDGNGNGFLLETAPIHPMLPGLFLGWHPDGVFRRDLHALGHLSPVGILLRDTGDGGRVRIRRDGSPRWDYTINAHDRSHIRKGIEVAAQVLMSAGATEVLGSSNLRQQWRSDTASGSAASFADDIAAAGLGSNRHGYVSFHQMGTARMGSNPKSSAVDGSCNVHGRDGVSVMDASLFPTASGVNPMITIAALAHRGATILADRLT